MTFATIRKLHSEQSAVEAAYATYAELRDRLLAAADERSQRVFERAFERGLARLDALSAQATDATLDEADQDVLDMFLTSARSDDQDQLEMWLGLLPESMERMLATAREEQVVLGAVAEEPSLYEVEGGTETFTYAPREWRSCREQARDWGQPAAV